MLLLGQFMICLFLFLETMSWSKPETKGSVPLPRSLHTASVIGNKYGFLLLLCFFIFTISKDSYKKKRCYFLRNRSPNLIVPPCAQVSACGAQSPAHHPLLGLTPVLAYLPLRLPAVGILSSSRFWQSYFVLSVVRFPAATW